MILLPSGPSWCNEPYAPFQRAASWNPYFYRFFGSDHDQVNSELRPLSGDESCRALWRVVDAFGGQHPRPITLKHTLARIWTSGYRPGDPDSGDRFTKLARLTIPKAQEPGATSIPQHPQDLDDAVRGLLDDSDDNPSRAISLPSGPSAEPKAPPSTRRDSQPTELSFDGNVWVVKKEYVLRCPFEGVTTLINPINWQHLAPFFKVTRQVDPPPQASDVAGSWSGVLNEKFIVNWNTFAVQSFDVFLNVDYTVAGDVTRADYSLKYETKNQIVVDDGYGEAQKVDDGVTRYIGCKRLRFASSFLNLVAPGILAMQLEQDEGGFRDLLERGARAIAPAVPAPALRKTVLSKHRRKS